MGPFVRGPGPPTHIAHCAYSGGPLAGQQCDLIAVGEGAAQVNSRAPQSKPRNLVGYCGPALDRGALPHSLR
jgi:hypothetical protein